VEAVYADVLGPFVVERCRSLGVAGLSRGTVWLEVRLIDTNNEVSRRSAGWRIGGNARTECERFGPGFVIQG
jgi:hypothetical protein